MTTPSSPDKLGLLLQCRMKMDQLNDQQIYSFADSFIKLLSISQFKRLFFVGCNSIRDNITYNQLIATKTCINEIIEQANRSKKKSAPNNALPQIVTFVPKNASLTE
eukprot:198622_1